MAKKTKKSTKPKRKIISKKIQKNQKKSLNKFPKKKKITKKKTNLEKEREKIFAELDEDDFEDLFYENDLENMPHDIFDIYDVPKTQKENQEYIKKLVQDSDAILYLLDARDVLYFLDTNFVKNLDNKLLIYVINKIDLVSEEYLKKIYSLLNQEINKNPKLFISCLIREKIQELYDKINIEIIKYKASMKSPKKRNNIFKIGVVGMPNVGKNSLIQSFELLWNSFCEKKYIFFGGNKNFCINSVPGVIYGNNEDEHLISKKYKNVKDLPSSNKLLNEIFKYIEPQRIKEIYELNKKPENLKELLVDIKKKFKIKNEILAKKKILNDIIIGKIGYEINY